MARNPQPREFDTRLDKAQGWQGPKRGFVAASCSFSSKRQRIKLRGDYFAGAILGGGMARENADLVWLMYEAFNRRDLDGLLALMHDSIELEPRFGALEGDYRGHEGVRRWWRDLLAFLPDDTAEVEEVRDLGQMTIARIRGRGHGAASAAPVVETWWQASGWRDGGCISWHNFATEAEALETIGLEAG